MPRPSSKKLIAIGLIVAIIIAVPAIWFATRRRPLPNDRITRMAVLAMKSDLNGLVMSEQATRRIRGRYLPDPEAVGHLSSPGVTTPVITVSDTGWAATVEYKTIPGIRCGIGVFMRNPVSRLARSGEIVCE